jgi:hypothetical protein
MSRSVPANRIARKVAGSAYGIPYRAPMNPVLQITTNTGATIRAATSGDTRITGNPTFATA